jgi:hypothetical protein
MSKQDLESIQQAENLLVDFLNRKGEPNEQLVSDALAILATLSASQTELEDRLAEARWAANPDRMGGAYTQEEINNSGRWI